MIRRFCLSALAVFFGSLAAAPLAEATIFSIPVFPEDGGRYPIGTYIRGICDPESALSGGGIQERTHLYSELNYQGIDTKATVRPTEGPAKGQSYGGSCEADQHSPSLTPHEGSLELGDAFKPIDLGPWSMQTLSETNKYEYSPPPEGDGSYVYLETTDLRMGPVTNFEIYTPCHGLVRSVKGEATFVKRGKKRKVKSGALVEQGDTLVVERGGIVAIKGFVGEAIKFATGRYAFLSDEECEAFFGKGDYTATPPIEPTPVKLERGSVVQASEGELDRAIEAGRDLTNEVIGNDAQRQATDRTPAKYRVEREGDKTTSCALEGCCSSRPRARRFRQRSASSCSRRASAQSPRMVARRSVAVS